MLDITGELKETLQKRANLHTEIMRINVLTKEKIEYQGGGRRMAPTVVIIRDVDETRYRL
jgi:hypothetical protein